MTHPTLKRARDTIERVTQLEWNARKHDPNSPEAIDEWLRERESLHERPSDTGLVFKTFGQKGDSSVTQETTNWSNWDAWCKAHIANALTAENGRAMEYVDKQIDALVAMLGTEIGKTDKAVADRITKIGDQVSQLRTKIESLENRKWWRS
jgi:hypothetical protein